MIRKTLPELGATALLLLLPLLLFAPVALGPRTLLPADVLFQFQPYRAAAPQFGVAYPQNHLLADLILENYAWKRFLVEAVHNRELPLWDPYIFAGHPFLANGQHSALYPLSIVFYVLPLWRAYGVFAWLQLGLAGVFTYLFARVLGIRRLGGVLAGITFQFSGCMVASVVHLMIIAGISWLPFILAMVELIVQQRPALGRKPALLPWATLGALGLGCQMLAGHGENTYLVLLITGVYVVWRVATTRATTGGMLLIGANSTGWRLKSRLEGPSAGCPPARTEASTQVDAWLKAPKVRLESLKLAPMRVLLGLVLMLVLGLALGAVQFMPMYEVVSTSFRGGEAAASLRQVLEWAYPTRKAITFAIPNFFGNPSHHGYLDVLNWRETPAPVFPDGQYIKEDDWGIKNYVEGGSYLGLLPLFLALIANLQTNQQTNKPTNQPTNKLTNQPTNKRIDRLASWFSHPYIPFFTLLSLFSLGCIFGTPLYALIYVLPFFGQSHSPFRWVFPLTLAVAILAGFGVEAVRRSRGAGEQGSGGEGETGRQGDKETRGQKSSFQSLLSNLFLLRAPFSLVTLFAALAFWGGVLTLVGLVLSRVFFAQVEPLVARVFRSFTPPPAAFPDHRAFYSYEFKWVALFGWLLTAAGIVLRVSRCPIFIRRRPVWEFLAVGVLVLDLVATGAGFNPAVDPALLNYVPPVIEFLRQDPTLWRYATFTPPGTTKTMNDNVGMFYGFQTVSGYDSLFSRQYADYMTLIEPQDWLPYNRIAPLRQFSSLDSPLTDLLNVKYVITEVEIASPKYRLVYQDEAVRVYENLGVMPRAFTLPATATLVTDNFATAVQSYDPRNYVLVAGYSSLVAGNSPQPATSNQQQVSRYTLNEVRVDATVTEPSWLILADSYFPGWKAFVQGGEGAEREVEIYRVNGNFRGVLLEPGTWTVRFKYSPDSVKIGAFVSFIAGMTILFLAGLYLWRFFYREEDETSTVRRVAKNSIAPIILNLFNQVILMAFAALMARIVGPTGNGRYYTAVLIFGCFEIVANFGLDMYLMREGARDRANARRLFLNAIALRVLLFLAVIPALALFMLGRQMLGTPLVTETLWTVALLYAGLLPGSLANNLAALFRACEKHEYPAAIQTTTAIMQVTLGTLALVGGLGIVGLAGASILTNLATLAILAILAQRTIWPTLPRAQVRVEWPLLRVMLMENWPLMASLLLQALFPFVNGLMLQNYQGDAVMGWYDAARKWLTALNVIPSLFTFAIFPVMSRQAAQDRSGLRRSYSLSVKLLTMLALPIAVLTTLSARFLVGVLSGAAFLPHGAIVLQILIWSAVFGWINSLTNFVLIALNRQRYVLLASGARVLFTIVANLLFVRAFSYVASGWIMVAGEFLLVLLFYADLRRHVGAVGWGRLLWRTTWAALVMGGVAWGLSLLSLSLALAAGVLVYPAALVLLRALTPEEREALAPLVPGPLRFIWASLASES